KPTGFATDGEVEDYAAAIVRPAPDTAVLVADPANPGQKVLVITGSSKIDNIQLQLSSGKVLLCKHGCKIATYSLASVGRIVVMGLDANGTVTVPASLNTPLELLGKGKIKKSK